MPLHEFRALVDKHAQQGIVPSAIPGVVVSRMTAD
jgi:hypothetical protein